MFCCCTIVDPAKCEHLLMIPDTSGNQFVFKLLQISICKRKNIYLHHDWFGICVYQVVHKGDAFVGCAFASLALAETAFSPSLVIQCRYTRPSKHTRTHSHAEVDGNDASNEFVKIAAAAAPVKTKPKCLRIFTERMLCQTVHTCGQSRGHSHDPR